MNIAARVAPPLNSRVRVELVAHCPDDLDALAAAAGPGHRFLRAAWFAAAGAQRTFAVRGADDRLLAALPLVPAGPAQLGAQAVTGCYWPFRLPLLADSIDADALAAALSGRAARAALGPLWRVGPFYAEDAAGRALVAAAARAGWTRVTRRLGRTYVLDIARAQAQGPWPRRSTLKRIGNYERQLAQRGAVSWQQIAGADWARAPFDDLAAIEAASWVGSDTDRSGAKFLNPRHRAFWQAVVRDPELAAMLSALILRLDGRPIAFCFDLNVGALQYSIAGSYAAEFGALKVGKIATYRNIAWAMERGIARIDWGSGDSGYKQEMGAEAGSEVIDCLFVRSPLLAAMLRPRWERAAGVDGERAGWLPIGRREMLIITSLGAAAIQMMAE